MTPLQFPAEMVFAICNTGLLTGIFFKLGGLARAHDDFSRRLTAVETKGEKC